MRFCFLPSDFTFSGTLAAAIEEVVAAPFTGIKGVIVEVAFAEAFFSFSVSLNLGS